MTRSCKSDSPATTRALGERLAARSQPGDVFLMVGQLGAGKTAMVQGIAAGLEVEDQVNSPTFVLMKVYRGRLPLYHFDLYRLSNIESTVTREWDEFLNGAGVSVVEWADLASEHLPAEHLLIEFEIVSETERTIRLTGVGERYRELVEQVG